MTLKWGSVLALCVTEFFHSKASQYEVNVECGSHRAVLYVVAKSLDEQHLELPTEHAYHVCLQLPKFLKELEGE